MMICVFCDNETSSYACGNCGEYKGLMTIEDYEQYTGEVWA
jgi:glycine cleavage system protein P-like pyridoxal-binding family